MKGGKKKSMLLAFQRDESTAFPKSPQRQHHREMEEKCCFFPSILMSKLCRLVKYYLVCACTLLCKTIEIFSRPIFRHLSTYVGVLVSLLVHAPTILDNDLCACIFLIYTLNNKVIRNSNHNQSKKCDKTTLAHPLTNNACALM